MEGKGDYENWGRDSKEQGLENKGFHTSPASWTNGYTGTNCSIIGKVLPLESLITRARNIPEKHTQTW